MSLPVPSPVWSMFCRVVDNFGDMGVCWRLARQLQQEQVISVQLWVDDIGAMRRFLAKADPQFEDAAVARTDNVGGATITLHDWPQEGLTSSSAQLAALSDVIVEAFGCGLPLAVIQAMTQAKTQAMTHSSRRPLWIHLEYLSAESWVDECHGLISTLDPATASNKADVARPALQRHFYFPGFTESTGGLLREHDVLAGHSATQSQPRMTVLRSLGLPHTTLIRLEQLLQQRPDTLLVSVFCYPTPAWSSWLQAIAESEPPTVCLASATLPDTFFEAAEAAQATVIKVPFLSQANYDRLLAVCDLNIVRGEDSFVRAQWAARPLLWHIYPQHDDAHLAKLGAFLKRYCSVASDEPERSACAALVEFTQRWNSGADCRKTWHYLRPQLPQLRTQARNWQLYLAGMPDLVTLLVSYCGEVRSTSKS